MAKKRRFSAAEARAEVIKAGMKLVAEVGTEPGLARVRLNDAIARSGVPRPSAYRVFTNSERLPQSEFRAALLVALVREQAPISDGSQVFDAASRVLANNKDLLDSGSPTDLAWLLREFIRVIGLIKSNELRTFESAIYSMSLRSLAMDPYPDPDLVHLFDSLIRRITSDFAAVYDPVVKQFGLRPRAGTSVEEFAELTVQASGMAILQKFPSFAEPVLRPTGRDGELLEWDALAVTVHGLVLSMLEPDPESDVRVDLASGVPSAAPVSPSQLGD